MGPTGDRESAVFGPGRSWRSTAVGLTHMLVIPQGFTLAVAGSVAICLGRQGFPGPVAVWLFVVGASVGFGLVVLLLGAIRAPRSEPVGVMGVALLNGTATVVVPLVAAAGWWVADPDLAFFVTGLAVHLAYVPLASLIIVLLSRRTAARRAAG